MDVKSVVSQGLKQVREAKDPQGAMKTLINKVFSSRNAFHFAHWKSQSYAEHEAIGGLYDGIIGKMDEIVETYQGKYGLIEGAYSSGASCPENLVKHVKAESDWIHDNKMAIAGGCSAVENMIDELSALYLATIYKLENLK